MKTAVCGIRVAWFSIAFIMRLLLIICALLVAGCTRVPLLSVFAPHKIDIQQGNYITQDMVAKLKPGMTRSQVRFLLGTPLITDPFHADRWDYVYVMQKGGEITEFRRMILLFQEDKLSRIEGDVVAASPGNAATKPAAAAPAQPR